MCVVSMIGDHYRDKWEPAPWFPDNIPVRPAPMPTWPPLPPVEGKPLPIVIQPEVTKEQFDELKKEVLEMKELLKRAIKYDQDNGEPECQIEEKMELLRKVAEMVGISLDDVIGPKTKKVLLTEEKA